MDKDKLRQVALGTRKATLVLKNCKIVNVFSGTIDSGDIAIEEGIVCGIGSYEGVREIDLCFSYVSPGFIDGHVHIESSMLSPSQFAKIVIPFGTTTVIADPHEIANVCGLSGIKYMLASAKTVPLEVKVMIPSCVPSTKFETSGETISAEEIGALKNEESILGLGEMMNYPGVINGDFDVYKKLNVMEDKLIDGHAPSVTGKNLNAYALSGIKTDHESSTMEELVEKVKCGMYVHLREGSATRNVEVLTKGITKDNLSRLMFCTDDKHPFDIHKEGHINYNINLAIKNGIAPVDAIKMATINVASCYGLKHLGAIAPGYLADIVIFDNLKDIVPTMVFKGGELVFKNKEIMFASKNTSDQSVLNTVRFNVGSLDFRLPLSSNRVHVLGLIKNNVTTRDLIETVKVENGFYRQENDSDILKLAVVERHHLTGNIGLGLVKGYGLKNGAVAMTIAHDSHNLVIISDNDEDMLIAAKKIKEIQGGIVLVHNHEVYDYLQLEVGGIMTENDYKQVEAKLSRMESFSRKMGIHEDIDDPFLSLAFLSLPVIPDLKVTDFGLFDVKKFKIIPLEAEGENL